MIVPPDLIKIPPPNFIKIFWFAKSTSKVTPGLIVKRTPVSTTKSPTKEVSVVRTVFEVIVVPVSQFKKTKVNRV